MNTYSDQRTDVSVFEVCDLSGDHATGDLDTIARGIRSGCDGISSGGCICAVQDVDLDGKIASGICICNALSAVLPTVAVVASTAFSVVYAVAAMASSTAAAVSAIALLAAAAVAAMALPAAAVVAAMALPAAVMFVVFATSTSIVGLPVAFMPPMVAASMTHAPAAKLPLTSTSVHPS
jgi:hypothetical protein